MRISFDLDDTIVCSPDVPREWLVPRWRRWWYPEPMREGTRNLMASLGRLGGEIWIYTTSYRSSRYIRGWFRSIGITIVGVVNQDRHDQIVGRQGPSKFPPAFGIDLHIGDSVGVQSESRRHGFSVLLIHPEDQFWASRVLDAVDQKRRVQLALCD